MAFCLAMQLSKATSRDRSAAVLCFCRHCKDYRRSHHLRAMMYEEKSTMTSVNFPVHRMHAIAAGSAAACVALNIAVHFCTPFFWSGYLGASYKTKLAWCNRIVSAVHVSQEFSLQRHEGGPVCTAAHFMGWSMLEPV